MKYLSGILILATLLSTLRAQTAGSAKSGVTMYPGTNFNVAAAFQPIALVAHTKAAGSSPGTTPAVNTTGATLLTALIASYSSNPCTASSVTSSPSNTFGCIQAYSASPNNLAIWYVCGATVGSSQTFSSALGGFTILEVAAFSNVASSSCLDVHNGTIGAGGGPATNTGSVTPTVNNDLCLFAGSEYVSPVESSFAFASPSVNGTLIDTEQSNAGVNVGGADGYYVQSTAGALSSTYTITGGGSGTSQVAAIACFKHS